MGQKEHSAGAFDKAPLQVLFGFLSRFLFVAFIPIGLFMLVKAAVQKIRGVEHAAESRLYPHLDRNLIGQKYFHQGHTWAMANTAGTVTVGLDNFTRKILGNIDKIELPREGKALKQGRIGWRLHRGDRILPQIAPIDGTIVEVNKDLGSNPSLAMQSPYENGWILKIKPARFKENLRNLLHGTLAEKWMDLTKSQLASRFPQSLGPVYQDGGELIDGVGNTLTEEEWEIVKREFFL